MRILTYNIQGAARGLEALCGAIRDIAADVACLNEVHQKQLSTIERLTGRRAIFGPSRRIGLLGRFGNAVMARERPRLERLVRLSGDPGLEPRSLLVTHAAGLFVATTHLGLVAEQRLRHAQEILDALPSSGPLILAGDLNERADGPAVSLLLSQFTDAFEISGEDDGKTFPSTSPDRRIDYILVRGIEIDSCHVGVVTASDHRPVIAETY